MLKGRLAKFGLELAEDKSRIIRFGRYARERGSKATFDFLGFTHVNGTSRNGKYIVIHRTSSKKMSAKMQAAKAWLRENMHLDKRELVKRLNVKLVGHYRYYGVTGNIIGLARFLRYVNAQLFRALCRRSQRGRITWET